MGLCFYWSVISPHFSKDFMEAKEEEAFKIKETLQDFYSSINVEAKDVSITSTNNGQLKLHGYEVINEIKPDSHLWAIVIHGYKSNVAAMRYDGRKIL